MTCSVNCYFQAFFTYKMTFFGINSYFWVFKWLLKHLTLIKKAESLCCPLSFFSSAVLSVFQRTQHKTNQTKKIIFQVDLKKDSKMKIKTAVNSLAAIFVILSSVNAVDRNKFRTCQQSSFCRRCRGKNYLLLLI